MNGSSIKYPILLAFSCLLLGCSYPKKSALEDELRFKADIHYYKLENGLKVVLNKDTSRPTVTVAVYYNIGFRNEQPGKTGFAHLFEHFMFQGSKNLGKEEYRKLVELNGGRQSATTRFDFTSYFQGVPKNLLQKVLWAESDRMKGLNLTQESLENQINVVTNEVDATVNNLPYGSFPWLDMPQLAFDNWYNSHNFYGDLTDLQSATLVDARQFFKKYYAPNNAVLVLSGDFNSTATKDWITKYFADIPEKDLDSLPDYSEASQNEERIHTKIEPKGSEQAFAFSYRMPPRNSQDYYAMGLINQLLLNGPDSWLHQELVQKHQIASELGGGINFPLGNMFNYNGPMLWTGHLFYTGQDRTDEIITLLDKSITRLHSDLISNEELQLVKTKALSDFYSEVEYWKFDFLACFALFDDNPNRINVIVDEFEKITPEQIRKTAQKYLTKNNRTRLSVSPGLKNEQGI